ncbi:ion channel [Acinetobacter sp. WZC-1]|uniref:ion channel n=1 Tax=Acinetobacter sp. WZC-1 TaxID=3459034 RepID=UPI00403E012D
MQILADYWKAVKSLPSVWLLLVQFFILILSATGLHSRNYQAFIWALGVLALLIIAKVIRQTPVFTALGLFFVSGACLFSFFILIGYSPTYIQVAAHLFEAMAYFCAAYGLLRYMFADRYVTKDELFAAAAVFTLIAWAFAFLYSVCQMLVPHSFMNTMHPGVDQNWLDLLFLSVSLQSATGLSDLMPVSAAARVIAMLQMFGGVMYLALVVSRLISLHYIAKNSD